jgi:hypothetical protein
MKRQLAEFDNLLRAILAVALPLLGHFTDFAALGDDVCFSGA